MKRIACLLSCSLSLLWAFQGVTAAQQLTGVTGQLDGNSDPLDNVTNPKAKEKIDKAKEKVDEVSPGVEEPVDEGANEVEKSADEVVEDVAGDAKGAAGTPGQASTPSKPDRAAPGSSNAGTKRASAPKQSGTASRVAPGAEPTDSDKVAAAGNTIRSAQVKGDQLARPEADVDQSEGSVLSSTGAQVLAWLLLACLLMVIGVALVWRRRTG
jgi:cobalamin biosynthesis Mg chelatase CobN